MTYQTELIILLLLLLFRVGPNALLQSSPDVFEWNYPACWETSNLKAAAFVQPHHPNSSSNYDKMIVVGDIHGNWNGLMEVLAHAGLIDTGSKLQCAWREKNGESVLLIQTGDVVDRGRFATECFQCLQHLQATAEMFGHRVIRLLGNHELLWLGAQYDYRNPDTDSLDKINKLTMSVVDDILRKQLLGSFYTEQFGGIPMLFTHAGLRKDMKSNILSRAIQGATTTTMTSDGKVVSEFVNDVLYRDILECYNSRGYSANYKDKIRCGIFLTDVIYSVGKERRGSSIGGVMWTDYHILEQEANDNVTLWDFVQIVGHTLEKGKIRTTSKLKSTCVDAGMLVGGRAYLSVSAQGRFHSFEKQPAQQQQAAVFPTTTTNRWRKRDLTSLMCV